MKKLLFAQLLFIICLSLNAYQWTYHFEQPDIIDGKVMMNSCVQNIRNFDPAIAIKPVRLLLPYQQSATSLQITYSNPVELDGEYEIKPVAPVGRISVEPTQIRMMYSSVYQKDEFYPAKTRSNDFRMQYKNGHPILITNVFPVEYNPVSKKIRYYQNITLNIETETQIQSLYRHDIRIEKAIKVLLDNPDLLDSYPQTQRNEDDYDYLVISPSILLNNLGSLTSFNLSRALKTKVTTKEEIVNSMMGIDTPEKIRNYIKQEYIDHGIQFVLLAGDNELLPHRGFRSQIMDYGIDNYDETDIPADMYFSCLDGTWKNEGSEYYGESGSEDLFYEVYTARFAVDSANEMDNLSVKTINYSLSPVNNSITNNLLVGEHLWGPPQFPTDTWGQAYMDEFLGECTANNYTTQGFTENWNTETLYDVDGEWQGSDLINIIEEHRPVWIDHLGHSNVTYNMKLGSNSVNNNNFTNDGVNENYFIIYSQGCYSGSFDNRDPNGFYYNEDCIGEKFTTIAKAAVAYIGNSRYGLGSPYDTNGSGQVFHRYFHDALFANQIHSVEMMNAYSKEINASLILETNIYLEPYFGQCKWIAYCVNVLGDPALSIWTAPAQELDLVLADSISLDNPYNFTTLPYAQIAFYNSASSYVLSAQADSMGYFSLFDAFPTLSNHLSQNAQDTYYLSVKSDNYYPYKKTLHVNTTANDLTPEVAQFVNVNNYPNPFNPSTTISFDLSKDAFVNLSIFNAKGQKISTLINQYLVKDHHQIKWNGQDEQQNSLGSGIYFYKLSVGEKQIIKKMLLLK